MSFCRRKSFEKQILGLEIRPKGRNFILVAEHETAMWVVDAVRTQFTIQF